LRPWGQPAIATLVQHRGLRRVRGALRAADAAVWDAWLGVATSHSSTEEAAHGLHDDSARFEATSHLVIRRILRMLPLSREDVCFDVGCGKGRTVCHFARMRVRKVVGIELSPRLAACATANARSLRGRVAPIEIRNTDAALADYDEGTLFFMFNPFGAKTMRAVLSRIEAAHRPLQRQVRIVYVNPVLHEALGALPWLVRERSVTLVNGLTVETYRTSFQ
jgi:precorrin-6B methylase 2